MLVITVKQGEHVTLLDENFGPEATPVIVRVLEAHEGRVKLGVDAPEYIGIVRSGAKSATRKV
jgi:sRNA-binding carbon storage regulator CsrA